MPRRRTTTSTRCTTAPPSSASTRARSSRRRSSASRCSRCSLPEISDEQPGRHAALPLPARRQRRPAARVAQPRRARAAARRGRSPATAAATPRRRGSSTGSCVRSAAHEAATPRFVDAVEQAAPLPAPAPERRAPAGARSPMLLLFPLACVALAPPAHAAVAQADAEPAPQGLRAAEAVDPALGEAARHRPVHRGGQAAQDGDADRRLGADAEGRPPARPGQDAGRHRVPGGARRRASW